MPENFTSALLHGRFLCEPDRQLAEEDELLFRRWSVQFPRATPSTRKIILLELEARLRRLAESLQESGALDGSPEPTGGVAGSKAELTTVQQMLRFVALHHQEALQVSDIVRETGLHPNYAMRLFRRTCGVTLLKYLTQQRIWHAQRLLSMTDDKMHVVAAQAGFGSASQFHEIFKRNCGTSPCAYRARLRSL